MKRYFVFVQRTDGKGWKSDRSDTPEEANHFAGLRRAEGREVHIKEMY